VLPLAAVASAMVSSAPSDAPQVLFIDLNMSWACGTRALSSAAAADNYIRVDDYCSHRAIRSDRLE